MNEQRNKIFNENPRLNEAKKEITANDLLESMEKIRTYANPYRDLFCRTEQSGHFSQMILGLTSDLERKSVEPIATLHGQDRNPLQHFIGASRWDWNPLQDLLCKEIGQEIGIENGVLVIDGSSTQKKATLQ
jgi:SRSO17 transposase